MRLLSHHVHTHLSPLVTEWYLPTTADEPHTSPLSEAISQNTSHPFTSAMLCTVVKKGGGNSA